MKGTYNSTITLSRTTPPHSVSISGTLYIEPGRGSWTLKSSRRETRLTTCPPNGPAHVDAGVARSRRRDGRERGPIPAAVRPATGKRIASLGPTVPSELVHLAFAGFLAVGLLGPAFGRRSVVAVFAAAALPDLDTFASLLVPGVHRALLHSLVAAAVLAALVALDCRRDDSILARLFGEHARRVGTVAVAAFVAAGIAPDLVTNGTNLFYPVVDQFYTVSGHLRLSSTRGIVQTFVDLQPEPTGTASGGGTTESRFYWTGVDPSRGAEPENVERVFPVVNSGLQLLVVATSALVVWGRFRDAED